MDSTVFHTYKEFTGLWYVPVDFTEQISSLGIILTFLTLEDKFATPAWRYNLSLN